MEQFKNPEEGKEHIDTERLKTLAHWWLLLLRKKGIAPEEIYRKEKEWPGIDTYTDEEIEGVFRGDSQENKQEWERFKEDWKHISECSKCLQDFDRAFEDQFR